MIDLTSWFDPEEQREHIRTPFNCSGKTVATNGHVIICVDQTEAYQADDRYENFINSVISNTEDLGDMDNFAPLDYQIPMPELEPCFICDGKGHIPQVKCDECQGEGTVYLHSGYNSYNHECEGCEGSGFYQEAGDCELCKTTGFAYPENSRVVVVGVPLNPKYYQLLINTSENLEVFANLAERKLFFRNSECVGLIMGMKDPN